MSAGTAAAPQASAPTPRPRDGGRPATLAGGAHWARRLDLDEDAKLCDILDEGIRRGPAKRHITLIRGLWPLAG